MNTSQSEPDPYAIVVGIDYCELSDLALERACKLSSAHPRTQLHVLHAERAWTTVTDTHGVQASEEVKSVNLEVASSRLHAHVEKVVRRWRDAHSCEPAFERLTTHVRIEPAADALAQLASDVEAELIIVATHGRRGARRFLLGSVAESIIRLAACDVLVVRPPDATIPTIEPVCPSCAETRYATEGVELWCQRHREHHEQAHTYHYSPAASGHQSGLLIYAK